jgi:hypothetical protein
MLEDRNVGGQRGHTWVTSKPSSAT